MRWYFGTEGRGSWPVLRDALLRSALRDDGEHFLMANRIPLGQKMLYWTVRRIFGRKSGKPGDEETGGRRDRKRASHRKPFRRADGRGAESPRRGRRRGCAAGDVRRRA